MLPTLSVFKKFTTDLYLYRSEEDFFSHYTHSNASIRSTSQKSQGSLALFQTFSFWDTGFSEIKLVNRDDFVRDNMVMTRWEASALHTGNFLGISGTQNKIIYSGYTDYKFIDGKIFEYNSHVNISTIIKQIVSQNCNFELNIIKDYNDIKLIDSILFTKKEIEVLSYLLNGYNHRQISQILCRSQRTIEKHTSNIMEKTGCNSREGIIEFLDRNSASDAIRNFINLSFYLKHKVYTT